MIYIGSSYCVRYKCHIRLDFFVSRLPAKFSRAIHIGTNLIIVLVVFAMVPACIATVMDQIAVKSSAMEISMALVFAAVPVGLVSTAVRILAEDVQLIREAFRKEEA
jgi:TRAP-type C4-dicarboxylate transport system permease small subunit